MNEYQLKVTFVLLFQWTLPGLLEPLPGVALDLPNNNKIQEVGGPSISGRYTSTLSYAIVSRNIYSRIIFVDGDHSLVEFAC
jgi:hypothetical protein